MSVFTQQEFAARRARAQKLMAERGIDALLLTTEPDVRYFTGFLTRFWESPTRPWFVVLPATGKPIAVIPSIGAALMAQAGVEDIRTWRSPDLSDDGVTLLADTLAEVLPGTGTIGVPDGHETHMRIPLADLARLKDLTPAYVWRGDAGLMRQLRMVKSAAEIARIEAACHIAGAAFERVPDVVRCGDRLDDVFRQFQILCLQAGADWVPYLAGGAGRGGYRDVISPASAQQLQPGDVLMLDTGLVRDGYFCDFDRNFSIGPVAAEIKTANDLLLEATHAGAEAAKPGARAADVYHAMQAVLSAFGGDTDVGRLGHGLGMSLTEWPSLIPQDDTVLSSGMVLTLEPGIDVGRGMLVHEENIAITESGARFLSPVAGAELVEL